jgi:hypothetical protein
VAKFAWHHDEVFPRIGSVVTNIWKREVDIQHTQMGNPGDYRNADGTRFAFAAREARVLIAHQRGRLSLPRADSLLLTFGVG